MQLNHILHHCCQVETIVLYQLVFTVKTVKIQLDVDTRSPCVQTCYGHISPTVYQRLPRQSPMHRGIRMDTECGQCIFDVTVQ